MNFAREAEQLRSEISRATTDKIASALFDAYERGRRDADNSYDQDTAMSWRALMREMQKESVETATSGGDFWNKFEDKELMASFAVFLENACKRHGRTLNGIVSRYRHLRAQGWNPWRT